MLGCVVFKNICFFLVYVTMCTRSWLWFALIACWLAMSEKALLKSIILKIPKSVSYQLLEYPIFKIWKIFRFQRRLKWKDFIIIKASQCQKLEIGPIWKLLISSSNLHYFKKSAIFIFEQSFEGFENPLYESLECNLNKSPIFSSPMNSCQEIECLYLP
jgi:hypothetical protein